MICRSISVLFSCVLVAVVTASEHAGADLSTESDPEVTVYRLRTDNPGEVLRDDNVAAIAENIEELILAHDYEREFLVGTEQIDLTKILETKPYYETSQKDLCMENNGNCSQKCETIGHQTVCSCHEGYTLTSTTDCSVSECDNVFSGTSGVFTIDKRDCQWLIKAPKDHIIDINVNLIMAGYYHTELATIYDGKSTGAIIIKDIMSNVRETALRSSGQHLLIRSVDDWIWGDYRLKVSYVTGFPYFQAKSNELSGKLVVPVSSLSEGEECLSLTYSARYGFLEVHLNEENDRILQLLTPDFSFKHPEGRWKRDIFRIPFLEEAKSLKFTFRGEGTKIYNLGRCLNFEYHAIGGPQTLGQRTVCRNGGAWNDTTQSCTCPPGFSGVNCEEGCGPNRYGENCSKVCSFVSGTCEGMIFCNKDWCSCAPGQQGVNCDLPCDSGSYGVFCKQRCGKCRNDEPCDRYTGICHSGCSAGYYPPSCQQTYKVLVDAPEIVTVTYNSLKIKISFEKQAGEGEPILYEVQYREENQTFWSKLSPRTITNETEIEIMGLLPGKYYETRAILLDKDGGSYQRDVPYTSARTKCIDPLEGNYKISAKEIDASSVLLEWSYEYDKTSLLCEIVEYELHVICESQQMKFLIKDKEGTKRVSGITPDTQYRFQLIGQTVTGKKTLPKEVAVHTRPAAPGRVRAVSAVPLETGRQLNVTWLPPWNSQGESLRYKVSYQCLHLLACEDISCDTSSGDIEVLAMAALLDNLQPHALYVIKISSMSAAGLVSPTYVINATTAHAASHVKPSAAENQTPALTNTSVLLSWLPPEDCSGLNGYIYGYSYALVDNKTQEIIQEGTIPETILSLNFSELTPNHCYDAHITLVTSGGGSLSNLLIIPFCTRSTAPDRVQSLTVYKRGRRMVGLRWASPLHTYGDIESFTISVEGSSHHRRLTTEPVYCGAWPSLYCYTVPGLSPGKKYHFKVQARNKEVSIDGDPASVEAITAEGASTPPVDLRIVNATESSMLVEWGMPDNVNGQLRSFLIIVEQIDSKASSQECCDEIPMQHYRVDSEKPLYQYEITGLSPASTYSVTVYAKTVTLGEESRITGHTRPPKQSLPQNALQVVETDSSSLRPDVVTLQIEPAERLSGVNRTYFLLFLTNDSSTQQPLHDNELATLLQSRFNESYHLLSEYTQEELENQPVVTIRLKELGFESTEIQYQKYALLLVQDYMGSRSIDIFITEDKEF